MRVFKLLKRLFRVTSVRLRLTLWNISVLALALIGCAVIVHATVRTFLITSVDQDLKHEADAALWIRPPDIIYDRGRTNPPHPGRQFSRQVLKIDESYRLIATVPPGTTPPLSDVRGKLPPGVSERHRFVIVRLRDPEGRLLPLHSPLGSREDVLFDPQLARVGTQERIVTLTADRQEWRVLTRPLTIAGKIQGSVQAAYPLQDLQSLLHSLDRTLLTLIPVALLITGLGGAFLTDRALRPVRQIARAASEVEGADLSRRLPVTGGDEFAELATTFNSMFGRLQIAFSRLEAAVEQQRRFTADASHELRTPLTTIKTNADWALRKRRRVAEYEEVLGSIVEAANRTNHLIEDLLCLARLDHDPRACTPHPVRVDDVLRRACCALPKAANWAPVSLDLPEAPLFVPGDADQLERLVINLVENALRHTPAEGHICVSAGSSGNQVVITVEDTGTGIPPEHLPYVCERFYRVDAARSSPAGGAGLGLSICRSIAQAHGGTLDIQSRPGAGTVVTVSLPV